LVLTNRRVYQFDHSASAERPDPDRQDVIYSLRFIYPQEEARKAAEELEQQRTNLKLATIRCLKLTVFDFAAGFQYLVPNLDAPATAVPLDLLGRAGKAFDCPGRGQRPDEPRTIDNSV
jgi:hypothetical protein